MNHLERSYGSKVMAVRRIAIYCSPEEKKQNGLIPNRAGLVAHFQKNTPSLQGSVTPGVRLHLIDVAARARLSASGGAMLAASTDAGLLASRRRGTSPMRCARARPATGASCHRRSPASLRRTETQKDPWGHPARRERPRRDREASCAQPPGSGPGAHRRRA